MVSGCFVNCFFFWLFSIFIYFDIVLAIFLGGDLVLCTFSAGDKKHIPGLNKKEKNVKLHVMDTY